MKPTIRVATWNMKQAVAPKKPLDARWDWAATHIDCDVYALTEAKVPDGGPPQGWRAEWVDGGFGPRRRWGTVLAARNGVEFVPVTEVGGIFHRPRPLEPTWPAGTIVADVLVDGRRWATVAAVYGITVNEQGDSCGHGNYSTGQILNDLEDLINSRKGRRLVVAGDFNLWPSHLASHLKGTGLVDLVEQTAHTRPPLDKCAECAHTGASSGCGHIWTHRNGNSPNAKRQQLDFILATPALASEVVRVEGGPDLFPDAWEVSDHAPLVAEFQL